MKGGNITRAIKEDRIKKDFMKIVTRALKEDLGSGDITTDSIIDDKERALGVVFPKGDGILCGVDIAKTVFKEVDPRIEFEPKMNDGDILNPGTTIATVIGLAASCLKAERTALNFLQHLSGIATLTRKFVDATEGKIKILDTRKTTPGLRSMEKYAVRTGGGSNHRFGLYDMVLIKDNHIQIAGSITNAVNAVQSRKKRVFIEVEVKTIDELKEILLLKVHRVMLDNMRPEQIKQAVETLHNNNKKIETEISGGINLGNIGDYVDCGADYVSIGAITHSAPAVDIALKMKSLGRAE